MNLYFKRILLFVGIIITIIAPETARAKETSVKKPKVQALEVCKDRSLRLPIKGDNGRYIYKCFNEKILKVSKKGVIRAKKVGKTTIIAKSKSKKKDLKFRINVVKRVKKIQIKSSVRNYWVGCKYTLKAFKKPVKNSETIYWRSSNPSVATVKNGTIKIISLGTVNIIAYTKSGKKDMKKIRVSSSPTLTFAEGNSLTMESGTDHQLKLDLHGYPNKNVKFRSNNTSIASVSQDGMITAKRPGILEIYVLTKDGKEYIFPVTVKSDQGKLVSDMITNAGAKTCNKLAIVAHPDDETLWGGGHMMSGDWFIICLTNGYNKTRANDYNQVLLQSGNMGLILNYPDLMKGERDKWTYTKTGIMKDLTRIIEYKDWDQIVTYNPDGVTGHIHHKLTYSYVQEIIEGKGLLDKLYYYGHYYSKGKVPEDLPSMTEREIQFKKELLECYTTEQNDINRYWTQMIPYENWIPAKEWMTP